MREPYTTRADVVVFCPRCFTLLSAVSCMTDERKPEPGDFSICAYCAAVLKYTSTMSFELSSLLEIPVHSRLDFAQAVQFIEAKIRDEASR